MTRINRKDKIITKATQEKKNFCDDRQKRQWHLYNPNDDMSLNEWNGGTNSSKPKGDFDYQISNL